LNARRIAALGALVVALLVAFGYRLVLVGREEMRASDEAFHQGNLRVSLYRARSAGLAFVPGAPHIDAARSRLISIAKGAESNGDFELAFGAWDALRLIEQETGYLGRGDTDAAELAEEGLARLRTRKEMLKEGQQVPSGR
jgi:hypothetical protein